jgi:GT2 family glycosyltransferase
MLPVAVVILNHNGAHHLERFLPSVLCYSTCASVIVADNGSTDGSVAWLKEKYPAVRIISFPGKLRLLRRL